MIKQKKFYQILNKVLLVFVYSILTLNSYGQVLTFVSVATVDTECGASTGSITLTPLLSGTYSYLWSNGETTQSITGLVMGDYSCTITKGVTTEIANVSIYRNWDIEKFIVGDPTLSIVGNSVTINPNLLYPTEQIADQRTHCFDKTPIDIENQTGSIFAKFARTHPNFPNQIANPDPLAPPVFYIELFESKDLSNRIRIPLFLDNANLQVVVGGRLPEKIYVEKGVDVRTAADYTGFDYTDGDQFEVKFLGNHQIKVYLKGTLIYSATLPQRSTNEYVATIGFNDRMNLDRRIAYDLKSSFCSDMPIFKTSIIHNSKYGAVGSIDLDPLDLNYVNNSYSYLWSNGSTNDNINNLSKGDYRVTVTNGTGATKIQNYKIYDKFSLQKAIATNSIVKIIDNHVTCDPALPMQPISDYRTHAYDPTIPIDIVQGGGSVKFRVAATHPVFPNQHSNTELYKGVFVIRLQEASTPLPIPTFFLDCPFQIVFQEDGRVTTNNRSFTWGGNYISTIKYPKGGYDVELRFVGNRVVGIYFNDIHVANRTITEPIDKCYLMIGFSDNPTRQRRIAYDMITSFESVAPNAYSELKQKLDGGYTQLEDNVLRIKYKQDYAVGGSGATINYKIYKWDRSSHSGSFNASMGINWEEIDLSSFNLNNNEYYTLEFEGNKGEKYVLRFKTKPI